MSAMLSSPESHTASTTGYFRCPEFDARVVRQSCQMPPRAPSSPSAYSNRLQESEEPFQQMLCRVEMVIDLVLRPAP